MSMFHGGLLALSPGTAQGSQPPHQPPSAVQTPDKNLGAAHSCGSQPQHHRIPTLQPVYTQTGVNKEKLEQGLREAAEGRTDLPQELCYPPQVAAA